MSYERCNAATQYGMGPPCLNDYKTCRWHKGWREMKALCVVFDGKGECGRVVNERGVYCDEHEPTTPKRCEWTDQGARCGATAEYGGRHCAGHAEMNLLLRARRATPLSTAVPARPEPNTVDHPAHYNHGTIEAIAVIEDWSLNFNMGNALKYLARADHKGTPEADLKKAIWYLQRELDRRKA